MISLAGKHILVGISGGIAAYKAIEVVSRLKKRGAEVKVVMTENARHLVSPLTLGEISGHPVSYDMWEEVHDWNVEHIALATWADAYLIVPATANVIGKIAHGIADDMLTTTVMATQGRVFLCPAMNTQMYLNPITQGNLEFLRSHGYAVCPPATGMLACGVEGIGRLPEPVDIVEWFAFHLTKKETLRGKTVIVTAGGTREAIDPVRYIGNHSSGKMGYAIAAQAALAGANTILISAPTDLDIPQGVLHVPVTSAQSMEEAIRSRYDTCDAVIMAAAVADYRIAEVATQKIKKQEAWNIELVKNPDILWGLGQQKREQILIGFAAETEHVIEHGFDKVYKKNLDMLVANDVSQPGSGFHTDTNQVHFLYPDGRVEDLPMQSKWQVAARIIDSLVMQFENRSDMLAKDS